MGTLPEHENHHRKHRRLPQGHFTFNKHTLKHLRATETQNSKHPIQSHGKVAHDTDGKIHPKDNKYSISVQSHAFFSSNDKSKQGVMHTKLNLNSTAGHYKAKSVPALKKNSQPSKRLKKESELPKRFKKESKDNSSSILQKTDHAASPTSGGVLDLGRVRFADSSAQASRVWTTKDKGWSKDGMQFGEVDRNHQGFPPPIADHVTRLKGDSSHSPSAFEDSGGSFMGIPAVDMEIPASRMEIPARDMGIHTSDIGIPARDMGFPESSLGVPSPIGGDFHHGLDTGILTSSGSEKSVLPQPGLDHQDHCQPTCVEGSVCLHLKHKSTWECICEGGLGPPHPETGCDPLPRGTADYDDSQGIILANHHKGIVDFNEKNFGTTNQTLSMLRQPTGTPESRGHLPEVIIPVVSCVVVIFLLAVFGCLYRRRRKLLYVKGKRDSILRNNDGAILLENMNTITKNPTYYYQSAEGGRRFNARIVPADCVKLGQVVGEGAFGQVFKGEMTSPDTDTKTKVAVKILKDEASHEAQEDFEREVEIMSAFDHDNILKLLGIVTKDAEGNPYMIFEFMEHGDLTELLRRNDPYQQHVTPPSRRGGQGQTLARQNNHSGRHGILLAKTDLVDISVQIANGMSYLASQHFVHRDLATRNCLVGAGLVVKISDFGMSRDIYTNDYYRIGGSRMLPVRWMSPEAIKYGRFTCESDIWAYGVVLWEIFSFGKQPYYGHTNEEVIHFLDQGILLQRPEDCPSTIYHVMIGCWKKDPRQRIIFERLVKYLRDYGSHLMNNQRQQQQQLQQQQEQQQQRRQQQRQLQLQLQLEKQRLEQEQTSPTEDSSSKGDGGTSCTGSERTEVSDFSDTPDDSNGAPLDPNPVVNKIDSAPASQKVNKYCASGRRQSTGNDCRSSENHSSLLSSASAQSDANVSSMFLNSGQSQPTFYNSHHHRSSTLPNNAKNSKSLFKTSGFSFKSPSSPRIFRTLSSKKAKKAASYSTLATNTSRADVINEVSYSYAKQDGRRYSSVDPCRFGSLKNILQRKLSGSGAIDNPSCDKDTIDSLESSRFTANKNTERGIVAGRLLMDRLNSGSKKSTAAPNAYDTSLLRASSFKSAGALSTNSCDELKAKPKSPNFASLAAPKQLQKALTPESRSTGIRLEYNNAENLVLRRAQSQKEPLITAECTILDMR